MITLYTFPSPNGAKVLAALYETGLDFETIWVNPHDGSTRAPDYMAKVPMGQIPAVHDPQGPGGRPVTLSESGAILWWLAEKTGQLLPDDPGERMEALQWIMWQVSGQGPVFGRLFTLFKGDAAGMEDRRLHEKSVADVLRILDILDARLEGRDFVAGDAYSIADIALWPYFRTFSLTVGTDPRLTLDGRDNIERWHSACTARPASKRTHETFLTFMQAQERA